MTMTIGDEGGCSVVVSSHTNAALAQPACARFPRLLALACVPIRLLAGCAGRLTGAQVPLQSMVSLSLRASAGAIRRISRQTALPIRATPAPGHTPEQTRGGIGCALAAPTLPAGRRWSFGESQHARDPMLFNSLIALVLVHVVMCAMFEPLILPAVILTIIVLPVFGVLCCSG